MKGVLEHFRLCLKGDRLNYYGEQHRTKVEDEVLISGKTREEGLLKHVM
jgi:hypothetical protein